MHGHGKTADGIQTAERGGNPQGKTNPNSYPYTDANSYNEANSAQRWYEEPKQTAKPFYHLAQGYTEPVEGLPWVMQFESPTPKAVASFLDRDESHARKGECNPLWGKEFFRRNPG